MLKRRDFLIRGAALAAGFAGLKRTSLAQSAGAPVSTAGGTMSPHLICKGYGPLVKDPKGVFDLPEGFSYRIIARMGEPLDDGFLLPGDPDGMAAFPTGDGRIALICNHELGADERSKGPFGRNMERLERRSKATLYDGGFGKFPQLGGTSTIIYNPANGQKELHYLSLAGTERNCAGGPTPWNSWITCEETNTRANEMFEADHGYNFEVPVSTSVLHVEAMPLKAMGRFRHEAVAVEPRSGIVYQTEDMGDGLIYRFLPTTKGQLHRGGRLQALAIRNEPSRDTRNWPQTGGPRFPEGRLVEVEWVDLEDVESPEDNLRYQGFDKGAARFARGEGMWYGNGEVYFACTNGGAKEKGQVFRYLPSPYEGTGREAQQPGRLELFVESGDADVLKNCDNLTVAPNGNLFICEDADPPCKLVGITPEGKFFEFGRNRYTGSELAGACFSPSGDTLFFNIQGNGQTLAVTGPWDRFEG